MRDSRARSTGGAALAAAGLLASAPLLAPAAARAGEPPAAPAPRAWFHHGLAYGSDASFHPARELLNGSFGILQISSEWRPLDEIHYRRGWRNLRRSLADPAGTVGDYGWGAFLRNEVFPASLRWRGLQYVPNYTLHLVGGGARHRAFVEWYRRHDFARPGLWAAATTFAHAVGVEVIEQSGGTGPSVDPVADMLLFDPGGALLFSSDRVCRFFVETLNLTLWSAQPMFDPVSNTLENAGENWSLRWFPRATGRVGLFGYLGMSDLAGISLRREDGLAWSAGAGILVDELQRVEPGAAGSPTYARVRWNTGLFLDRDGSLLASLFVSEGWTQRLRLNVYPGVVRVGRYSPGLYLGLREPDTVILGVSAAALPFGLARGPRLR